MDLSRFDKYFRYVISISIVIAVLTYWRFRSIELPIVYSYVAQQSVVQVIPLHELLTNRSLSWNFFGLIDRLISPHSVFLLKVVAGILVVLDLVMLSKLVGHFLGQKFWSFIAVFLVALSPFAVLAATTGGPAAIAVAFGLLFLMALYRQEYIFAGIVSALGFAANLPGLIMFLIVILALLQDQRRKEGLVGHLLLSSAVFILTALIIYLYSLLKGYPGVFFLPLGETDVAWTFVGVLPLIFVNLLNFGGIVYLVVGKRYEVYSSHFHTLMLWIASVAFCIAQRTTLNLFFAITVSSILAMIFLHEFTLKWQLKIVSVDTFLLLFVTIFLFTDLFANNRFVQDRVLADSIQRSETVNEVVDTILSKARGARVVSNFVPAELAVRIGSPVVEAQGNLMAMTDIQDVSSQTVFVTRRKSEVYHLPSRCKLLFSTSYLESQKGYTVQVIEYGVDK